MLYHVMKMQGKVVRTATMALPALTCKWFLDTENEWFHDDPYDADDPFSFLGHLTNPNCHLLIFQLIRISSVVGLTLLSARGV